MLATLSLRAGEELINCFSHPPLHLNDGEGPPDPWQPFLNASSRHVPGQHFPAWVRKNCDLSAPLSARKSSLFVHPGSNSSGTYAGATARAGLAADLAA